MQYETLKNEILNSFSASFRLKEIVKKLDSADKIDALYEIETLKKLFEMKR